jgi:uncharacterized membrane protein YjjP (DUF1212 family)
VVAAENARFGEVVVANGAQKGVLRELQRRFQPWGLHLQVAVAGSGFEVLSGEERSATHLTK